MNFWLMKSEPSTFSIDDLIKKPKQIEPWEGVRNYQARNFMRDKMKTGDLAFFYHSNCTVPGIVGIVEIVKESYVDSSAFDIHSNYYDPKSTKEKPRWFMVDVQFKEKFTAIISLNQLKNDPQLKNMIVVQPGNRLSVMPVTANEWKRINNHYKSAKF